jgi:hypothetical protein
MSQQAGRVIGEEKGATVEGLRPTVVKQKAAAGEYGTHQTRNGAFCCDLYDAVSKSPLNERDEGGRTDRIYHRCAFGPYSNPRFEWVNVRNLRGVQS